MIRRLSLTNWRNYADVTVRFEPGTTFVVAVNGIGKTSLVEAARWALFGQIAGNGAAIRAGATTANATVELELPSLKVLTISRDHVVRKTNRVLAPEPQATLDGAPITAERLHDLLMEEFATEPGFLSNVTMPAVEAAAAKPDSLGLEHHLGRYYGVHGLRQAADVLNQHKSAIAKRINSVKTAHSTSAKQLIELTERSQQAAAAVADAEAVHARTRTAVEQAQQRSANRQAILAWQAQAQDHTRQLANIRAELLGLVDGSEPEESNKTARTRPANESTDAQGLPELIGELITAVETERAAVNMADVRLAVIAHTVEALEANRARLDDAHDAHGDCPVCRRPLDEATTQTANEATAHDLRVLNEELNDLEIRRTKHAQQLAALTALYNKARSVIPLAARPTSADAEPDRDTNSEDPEDSAGTGTGVDDADGIANLAQTQQAALEGVIQARADLTAAERELASAQEADAAMRRLQDLFDKEARVSIALDATEKTLRQLLDEAVRPMASAVNQRWSTLFPDRGPLSTAADGTVTRTVNGQYDLPFDSFSAGEGAGLTLLIRLVVASMATNANFCWFDEPLEHMDPDTRRHVASMLTRAGSGDGPLQQIVLTTYEETLARQLRTRNPERVHLIDVRQSQNTP